MCTINLIWLIWYHFSRKNISILDAITIILSHGHLGPKQWMHSFILPPWNTSLNLGHRLFHKNTFLEIKLSLQHPLVHSKHWASFTVFTAGHASFLELIPSGDSRQRAGHNHCQRTGFPKTILCEKHLLFNHLNLRWEQEYLCQSYSMQKLL